MENEPDDNLTLADMWLGDMRLRLVVITYDNGLTVGGYLLAFDADHLSLESAPREGGVNVPVLATRAHITFVRLGLQL